MLDFTANLFYFLPALAIVAVTRMLRPWVLVRFGRLESDRIGHFAWNTEIYLCERQQVASRFRKVFDIFYCQPVVCNRYLKKMWGRLIYVLPCPRLISASVGINRVFPAGQAHNISLDDNYIDKRGFFAATPAHLHFSDAEKQRAGRELKKMGISEGAYFVCLHARDPLYLKRTLPLHNWDYHDYRNSEINDYLAAAQELVKRGYFVLRMGALVQKPLVTDNPMIIDYAVKYRSEFLDLYLSAHCSFFISSVCGIDEVARIFRRQVLSVNCIPLEFIFSWNPSVLFIPKKLWLRKEGRFLTFKEAIARGIGLFDKTGQYREAGVDIINNTPEEIASAVKEADERLKGAWRDTAEAETLQRRFWKIMEASRLYRKVNTRIGAEFLRQNQHLLD